MQFYSRKNVQSSWMLAEWEGEKSEKLLRICRKVVTATMRKFFRSWTIGMKNFVVKSFFAKLSKYERTWKDFRRIMRWKSRFFLTEWDLDPLYRVNRISMLFPLLLSALTTLSRWSLKIKAQRITMKTWGNLVKSRTIGCCLLCVVWCRESFRCHFLSFSNMHGKEFFSFKLNSVALMYTPTLHFSLEKLHLLLFHSRILLLYWKKNEILSIFTSNKFPLLVMSSSNRSKRQHSTAIEIIVWCTTRTDWICTQTPEAVQLLFSCTFCTTFTRRKAAAAASSPMCTLKYHSLRETLVCHRNRRWHLHSSQKWTSCDEEWASRWAASSRESDNVLWIADDKLMMFCEHEADLKSILLIDRHCQMSKMKSILSGFVGSSHIMIDSALPSRLCRFSSPRELMMNDIVENSKCTL